jgi:omega-6 fatty acid desaturase (delta-12 desaturase)
MAKSGFSPESVTMQLSALKVSMRKDDIDQLVGQPRSHSRDRDKPNLEAVHSMSSIARIKQQKRSIINQHAKPDNRRGFTQVLTTLVPLSALWWVAVQSADVSYWLTGGVILLMSLFLVRVFVLMHDCGHGSLFRTAALNRSFGFAFGVIAGISQYVWSRHHAYHHATNGNWAKYRGPLAIVTVDEYEALTDKQRRNYERTRSTWLAPLPDSSI